VLTSARDAFSDPRAARLLPWADLGDGAPAQQEPSAQANAEADITDTQRRQTLGELASDLDPAMIQLALMGAILAPISIPQVAGRLTGLDPAAPRVREVVHRTDETPAPTPSNVKELTAAAPARPPPEGGCTEVCRRTAARSASAALPTDRAYGRRDTSHFADGGGRATGDGQAGRPRCRLLRSVQGPQLLTVRSIEPQTEAERRCQRRPEP
jgi:Tetracyclin repressor-like, C-terminal domain